MSVSGFFVDVSDRAVVSLKGSESLDLIHRISTNDVQNIPIDNAIQTVFTNEKGRIVEVAVIFNRDEEGLLVAGQGIDPTLLKDWIEKFIIMENIEVQDLSGDLIHFMLFDMTSLLDSKELDFVDAKALVFVEMFGSSSLTHVMAPRSFRELIETQLGEVGIQKCDYRSYDEYRILHGIPGSPAELSTSYNPLEAGLGSLISFTKGCYVGQEIIARLDTYQKVQRRLVRLILDEVPPSLPATIYRQDQEWGAITSAIELRSHGQKGLGYVKSGKDESLDNLCFRRGTQEIKIEVVSDVQ